MAHSGAAQVDIWRRGDENGQVLVDYVQPNLIYIGITPLQPTTGSETKWQIKRLSLVGTLKTVEYANHQKYNNIWNDRASLFPAPPIVDNGEVLPEYLQAFPDARDEAVSQRYQLVINVNSTTWTELSAGFTNYNQLSVRNKSGVDCVVNGDNTGPGIVGYPLDDLEELNYNEISTAFKLYAKSTGVDVSLHVEVLRTV